MIGDIIITSSLVTLIWGRQGQDQEWGSRTSSGGSGWSGLSDIRYQDDGDTPLMLRVTALFGSHMIKTTYRLLLCFIWSANDDTRH